MLSTTIFGLALAGLSTAQSTVSLWIPGSDPMPLEASVIASDAAATTYAVKCPSGTDASDCGLADGAIITQGPKTFAYTLSLPYEYGSATVLGYAFASIECSLGGTTSAICTESIGGDEANFPGISTETFGQTDITFQAATLVTSSLSVPTPGAAVATTTSASPASTIGSGTAATKTSGSSTGSSTGSATSGSTSKATGAAATSSTSTGGMAMVTSGAQWVIGGAALAAALL